MTQRRPSSSSWPSSESFPAIQSYVFQLVQNGQYWPCSIMLFAFISGRLWVWLAQNACSIDHFGGKSGYGDLFEMWMKNMGKLPVLTVGVLSVCVCVDHIIFLSLSLGLLIATLSKTHMSIDGNNNNENMGPTRKITGETKRIPTVTGPN